MTRPLNILLSAYACEPNKGSEPGLGWGWLLAHHGAGHRVTVLTRANNRPNIEAYLQRHPMPDVHFTYVELPKWLTRRKRGAARLRIYYALWQILAYFVARPLVRQYRFDLIHHATFAKYWSLTWLAFLPVPFLFGPVGGGETCPWRFLPGLGWRGAIHEILRALLRGAMHLNPLLHLMVRRSRLAVATTPDTARALRRLGARHVIVHTQVAIRPAQIAPPAETAFSIPPPWRLICAGDLSPHKGLHLILAALARLPRRDWGLDIVGKGRAAPLLLRQAKHLGIDRHIRFLGYAPQPLTLSLIGRAHVLLFAGLHDSGGMVCLEALAHGTPVIALDLGGPSQILAKGRGTLVSARTPGDAVSGLASALDSLLAAPHDHPALSSAARRAAMDMTWDELTATVYAAWDSPS